MKVTIIIRLIQCDNVQCIVSWHDCAHTPSCVVAQQRKTRVTFMRQNLTYTYMKSCMYSLQVRHTHKMSVLGLQLSNAFYTRAGNLGPKRTCVVVTYSIGCRVWPHARTTHHSSPPTKCWSIYVSLFERVNRIHKRPTCRFHPFVWIHCYLTVYYPAQYISIDVFVLSKNCDHLYPAMYV